MDKEAYNISYEEGTIYRYDPSFDIGLSSDQVKIRTEQGCTNTPVESPSKSVKEIILGNVCTFIYFFISRIWK